MYYYVLLLCMYIHHVLLSTMYGSILLHDDGYHYPYIMESMHMMEMVGDGSISGTIYSS